MSEYTDLRTLPGGTSFRVINGNWTGTVFSKNGKKYMHIDAPDIEDREITGSEELCVKTFIRTKTVTIRVPERADDTTVIAEMMHQMLDIPLSDCREAYNIAIEHLRSKARVKG